LPYVAISKRLSTWLAASALAATFSPGVAFAQAEPPPSAPASAPPDGTDPAPALAPPPAPAAQPAPSPAPAPVAESPLVKPKIDLTVPEPTPSVVRKMHNHDGFYLRFNVGFEWSGADIATDAGASHPDYTLNGGGISLDLLVGGTPSPSLTVGGGVMLKSISDPEVRLQDDREVGSGSGGVLMVGPFVDGFPMSNGGLHLGGLVGFATGTGRREESDDDFGGAGIGAAAWVGQGFWVGSEVSVGFVLKLDAAFMRDDSGPVALTETVYGGALSFSVLYH
jgi:hypothetical protein